MNVVLTIVASSQVEADYQHYQVPSSGSGLSENILRAGKLEETLTEGRATHPASEGKYLRPLYWPHGQ